MLRQEAIFDPFMAMLLLTFAVWAYMYSRRIRFLHGNRIDLSTVDTPDKAVAVIPTSIALPSHNLRNLFELPVVFYALCLYWYVTSSVDTLYVGAAWTFVGLRIIHSLIHCSYNRVMHRFIAYFTAAIVLWFMLFRTIVNIIATN